MKSLVARMNALDRQTTATIETILVAYGTDPATWPQPQAGNDAIYLTVFTGVERPGDDPAACEAALAKFQARRIMPPRPG